MGYTYPNYVWIIIDWFPYDWWTVAEDNNVMNCSDDEVQSFMDKGVITLHSLQAAMDYTGPTDIAGIVSYAYYYKVMSLLQEQVQS